MTSSSSQGQSALVGSVSTSSTMIFWISGANAAMPVPTIATANAAIASALCGATHRISRRIQPCCFWSFVSLGLTAGSGP